MHKSMVRPAFVQPEDLLDKLYKAWISHKIEELPLEEQRILERMEYADGKLRDGGTGSLYRNLVEDMVEKFKDQGLSKRTLENDIARAKRFFLSVRPREEKEYARGKSIEWLERLIWKAEAAEDFRAAALLMKELDEIQNFKKEDPNRPDYDKYERKPILVLSKATDIGLLEVDETELDKLRGSKAAFLSSADIEEIDFEEEDPDGI